MNRKTMGSVGAVVLCVSLAASQGIAQSGSGTAPAAPSGSASASAPPAGSAVPAAPTVIPLGEALTGDARSEYESGKMLYGVGDFAGALVKFQRAYDLSKDGRLLWNMAVCEKNQRHYVSVTRLVARYQAEAATVMSEQDRQDAEGLANAVKGFVSAVKIQVDQPQAAVSVDGVVVGESPLTEPVLMDMGPRQLKISKPGYKDFVQTLQIPGTMEVSFVATLEEERHEGRLVVVAEPGQTVWLDGKAVGIGRWEGVVTSGGHSLRITEKGKKTYQTEVAILDDQVRQLRVALEPEVQAATASDNTWMWIAGGVALSAGLAVGGYFLLRPEDEPAPGPTLGTMQPGTVQLPLMRFGR